MAIASSRRSLASPVLDSGRSSVADADEGLVELLKQWRLERSRADGVPAFVVFHDSTLRELAAAQPRSLGELGAIKGLGPAKLERYGDDLLTVLAVSS